ncbi:FAD-dependent monooxygenase [Peribacillus psychrosaccharolyticus]|uniref:FAD-dependent monooxygenase n=1 Tax=Peribacillus psychrosaccharolyticus TaxID=1407 RepID=A0A974S1J6_PERPY|nr:FAD-dependent monooxygenase [Peribacillus psychrosaccharolyticus]QQT00325.1 FAD-dependent monooxygenase [Peribacillus psychrosaccharolyticus]
MAFHLMTQKRLSNYLKLFNDWDEQLKNYIRHAEDCIVKRRVGFKWERKTNVTLIGDAVHVMSPFVGEGVNMAMYNALNLA